MASPNDPHGRRPVSPRRTIGRLIRRAPLLLAGALLLIRLPLLAQEVAGVEVRGQPVLSVGALGDTSAADRAARIRQSLIARLASDAPLAPIRIAAGDSAALLLIGQDTVLRVTARDAEVVLSQPVAPGNARAAIREVALQWANTLTAVFERAAAEERARVVVQGLPLFEVGGTADLRAARRAEAVGLRIAALAAAQDAPGDLAVQPTPQGAQVVVDGTVLLEVGPAEAATFDAEPAELAAQRAASIERVVRSIRQQRSWPYRLQLLGYLLATLLAMVAVHVALRRLSRRLESRARAPEDGFGLRPVILQWAISALLFWGWVAVAVFLLWMVPATRPVTFDASAQAVALLGAGVAWLRDDAWILALIVLFTYFVARFAGAVVRQLIRAVGVRHGGRVGLRAETLEGTVARGVQLLIFFIGVLAILAQLDVDLVPVLASAGVAGIAIGFGVQSLIRDFFTGLFILIEDQYGVGDLIQVGAVSGKVERFTLRITQIRSLDGSLTSIPNGEIITVTNLSKDWSQVVLDVNIALGEDVDRAIRVINETANELTVAWGDRIQGEAEVLGVETVDPMAQAITIRVVLRTAPLERWTVSRELRRRVLDAFRAEKIQVPPRAVVTLPSSGEAGP